MKRGVFYGKPSARQWITLNALLDDNWVIQFVAGDWDYDGIQYNDIAFEESTMKSRIIPGGSIPFDPERFVDPKDVSAEEVAERQPDGNLCMYWDYTRQPPVVAPEMIIKEQMFIQGEMMRKMTRAERRNKKRK